MNNLVVFNNNNIELIEHNNQAYMTLSQIVIALNSSQNHISQLYARHANEFDEEMSCLIKKGRTRVRIFNREGAWLIGMFARTPVAADFRKWVLKTLGSVADAPADRSRYDALPFDPVSYTPADFIGNKEFMKAIGGMVKKCCAVAIKDAFTDIARKEPVKVTWPQGKKLDESLMKVATAILDYGQHRETTGRVQGMLTAALDPEFNKIKQKLI